MDRLLSDDDVELLAQQFRIWDPLSLPGLTHRAERGIGARQILHWYDETPPRGLAGGHKPRIPCAFGHLHWSGVIAELDDGRIVLVGNGCALKNFGCDFIRCAEINSCARVLRKLEPNESPSSKSESSKTMSVADHLCDRWLLQQLAERPLHFDTGTIEVGDDDTGFVKHEGREFSICGTRTSSAEWKSAFRPSVIPRRGPEV